MELKNPSDAHVSASTPDAELDGMGAEGIELPGDEPELARKVPEHEPNHIVSGPGSAVTLPSSDSPSSTNGKSESSA